MSQPSDDRTPGPASETGRTSEPTPAASGALPLLAASLLVCVALLGWTVPRSLAYDDLLQENLALKARLREVDSKLSDVDRILLRLRLYDAQLRSLADPEGDHGPIPPDAEVPEVPPQAYVNAPMEPIGDADWDQVRAETGLRPAEAWADSVQDRADAFLRLFEEAEPDLSRLVADMEELRALDRALPRQWPAQGHVTSTYGWRHNPMGGRGWDHHSGLDISNRPGTPIRAPAPGVVSRAWFNSGYGNMIELDHGFGITTIFAHLRSFRVREGDTVEPGQLIGTMGTTGRSTGPHLHYEVRIDGHAVNPLDYLVR